ncbi:hypothetical protein [Burkholderia pyrrocinia]|uniref:SIS domain-containing protein n=1 Tax=Burkholderia pyrrocinia TaxID=60550 RepID=A0ABZ3BNG9_BURPY
MVISLASYSREAARVAEVAREQGSMLVAITDSAASLLALNADEVLFFTHGSPSFFLRLSRASAIAACRPSSGPQGKFGGPAFVQVGRGSAREGRIRKLTSVSRVAIARVPWRGATGFSLPDFC